MPKGYLVHSPSIGIKVIKGYVKGLVVLSVYHMNMVVSQWQIYLPRVIIVVTMAD